MTDLASIPVGDLQRNLRARIRRLRKSGKTAVLTVNGHAEVAVQCAAACQKLLDELELVETIRGISRGFE